MSLEERKQRFFELHLESMISNPTEEINKLLKFLDLKESEKVHQLASSLLHRNLTFSASADNFHDSLNYDISEESLLRLSGSDLRNLIFQHSYHL
jgi:hypothetical protein